MKVPYQVANAAKESLISSLRTLDERVQAERDAVFKRSESEKDVMFSILEAAKLLEADPSCMRIGSIHFVMESEFPQITAQLNKLRLQEKRAELADLEGKIAYVDAKVAPVVIKAPSAPKKRGRPPGKTRR